MAERTQSLHAVQQMIQALGHDAALQARLGKDPDAVFAEFGLTDVEIAALKECTIEALAGIDVHPMFRMHWLLMSNPDAAKHLSVREYIAKANEGAKAHGGAKANEGAKAHGGATANNKSAKANQRAKANQEANEGAKATGGNNRG